MVVWHMGKEERGGTVKFDCEVHGRQVTHISNKSLVYFPSLVFCFLLLLLLLLLLLDVSAICKWISEIDLLRQLHMLPL